MDIASIWRTRAWLYIGMFVLFVPSTAFGHPFHHCVGQMKWNPTSKVWEVSLRLHPQDLEAAMAVDSSHQNRGQRISIEDREFSTKAIEYLSSRFFVRRTPLAMNQTEMRTILHSESLHNSTPDSTTSNAKSNSEVSQSKLRWVGMESDKGWLWIHLELQLPEVESGRHRLWMINRILLDHVEKQENSVTLDPTVTPKYSLQFKLGEEFQPMR